MLEKQGYIYIMTNKHNNVLYVGVTSNLQKRVYEHKHKLVDGFTKNYNIDKLVYYEVSDNIESAILREKQFKAGSRKNKMELIIKTNPDFNDLYDTL
ncbi:MAG: excinuclease ABC subunit C [Candidatus Omnitrophica bacterium CG12_big_fil_rev_8_21_14_0_65_43_15]|uniref:Excinuclease ABC subunit C n=1 Tax=Candidatus Taenaricola geysiri TaxID=1974752 RepID=A0A2J0LG43_9BACT|nr:MAG: excinuclease ABC subunit C [Candidatus Omnitrophica bacterium CG1_02_43_210]PIR65580.1 MAG: excinuclease ABC subunit C [Candidatus Omnitrophica bacterium CG10_big_fil_rev_8_21_14_0_10_43_8]PIV12438.1 MAG: excinuclease ABC subunit C [Candidatus Omnitrophica bacterium CG03_land_8_20_14_0_80_43_22]PIW66808.1 MAG: excinuclease ABC subunit C [Candidatus Omnitrophica bacterium CG12_big_fil_rev_8_21_14_0_65_43_15]PIW80407.1 MAG: excinuclease ABC subunit C [Candidatus Omnitrophica bacterium CG_